MEPVGGASRWSQQREPVGGAPVGGQASRRAIPVKGSGYTLAVSPSVPPSPARSFRLRWQGSLSIGVGLALIVAATLWLAIVGYGGHVRRQFAERRSYDMVKTSVHQALPGVLLTGLGGLGLILLGARLRRRANPLPTQAGPAES